MDQEALLELARRHLIRYASEFAPFVVGRAEGSCDLGPGREQ